MSILIGTGMSISRQPSNTFQMLQPIILPKAEKDGGKYVLAAIQERRTNRNISSKKLPQQRVLFVQSVGYPEQS